MSEQGTFSRRGLIASGFSGFLTATAIQAEGYRSVPADPGVYLVYREATSPPAFLTASVGGWFKGKDPSVPVDVLRGGWVATAQVVYIGKVDAGSSRRGLRKRISEFLQFGDGKPVGHWGGRYIWQLEDHRDLLFAWRVDATPRRTEGQLIRAFQDAYGARPYANLRS